MRRVLTVLSMLAGLSFFAAWPAAADHPANDPSVGYSAEALEQALETARGAAQAFASTKAQPEAPKGNVSGEGPGGRSPENRAPIWPPQQEVSN